MKDIIYVTIYKEMAMITNTNFYRIKREFSKQRRREIDDEDERLADDIEVVVMVN